MIEENMLEESYEFAKKLHNYTQNHFKNKGIKVPYEMVLITASAYCSVLHGLYQSLAEFPESIYERRILKNGLYYLINFIETSENVTPEDKKNMN